METFEEFWRTIEINFKSVSEEHLSFFPIGLIRSASVKRGSDYTALLDSDTHDFV